MACPILPAHTCSTLSTRAQSLWGPPPTSPVATTALARRHGPAGDLNEAQLAAGEHFGHPHTPARCACIPEEGEGRVGEGRSAACALPRWRVALSPADTNACALACLPYGSNLVTCCRMHVCKPRCSAPRVVRHPWPLSGGVVMGCGGWRMRALREIHSTTATLPVGLPWPCPGPCAAALRSFPRAPCPNPIIPPLPCRCMQVACMQLNKNRLS